MRSERRTDNNNSKRTLYDFQSGDNNNNNVLENFQQANLLGTNDGSSSSSSSLSSLSLSLFQGETKHESSSLAETMMNNQSLQNDFQIPDDVLQNIFAFVGMGHYYFVAGTCQQYKRVYKNYLAHRVRERQREQEEERVQKHEQKQHSQDQIFIHEERNRNISKSTTTKDTGTFTSLATVAESISRCQLFFNHQKRTTPFGHYNIKTDDNHYYDISTQQHIRDISYCATRHGHLNVLNFLFEKFPNVMKSNDGIKIDKKIWSYAARKGKIEILQWAKQIVDNDHLREHPMILRGRKETICIDAAEYGHLNVLKWAWDNDYFSSHPLVCAYAAKSNHLDVLQYVRSKGCSWNYVTCEYAAQNGNLKVLQWARANGCPWGGSKAAIAAAENGHLDVLEWALADGGCPWDPWICRVAADCGHLAILQLLMVEKGYPWSFEACANRAAFGGHAEILIWLYSGRYINDHRYLNQLVARGNKKMAEWAKENGYLTL